MGSVRSALSRKNPRSREIRRAWALVVEGPRRRCFLAIESWCHDSLPRTFRAVRPRPLRLHGCGRRSGDGCGLGSVRRYVATRSRFGSHGRIGDPACDRIHGLHRARLRRFAPPSQIRMGRREGGFSIEFAGSPPQLLSLSGGEVRQNDLRLRARLEDGALRHTGVAEDGRRENVFRLIGVDGPLMMETTIISPNLPLPVHFTLSFTREGSSPVADQANPNGPIR
jgi:hypothetical protein